MEEFSLEASTRLHFIFTFSIKFSFYFRHYRELLIIALSSAVNVHLQIHFNLQLWPANRPIPDAISYCNYTVSYLSVCLSVWASLYYICVSVCLSVYLERIVFQGWASLRVCPAATRRIISGNNSNTNNGNKISKQKQQRQQ